jgi:hypothetical protein
MFSMIDATAEARAAALWQAADRALATYRLYAAEIAARAAWDPRAELRDPPVREPVNQPSRS